MDLETVIKASKKELFDALDPDDGKFYQWARGRLAPVDRFLSNFHKPLQRRMLFTNPKDKFPESGVIKLRSSGEIFLIGESREDTSNDKVIDKLTVVHSVSNTSSGVTSYFNYKSDLADPLNSDIGKTDEGQFYVSVEYVSTKSAESGDEAYQGKFLVYGPTNLPFERDGVFTVNGKSYKVVQGFTDSGFSCAIVLEQEDDMIPAVYHAINEATSGYDVTTGKATLNTTDYTFAATIDHQRQDIEGNNFYTVYIKHYPLPIEITAGNNITLGAIEAKILSATEDKNTQGQLQLICEGG